VSNKQRSEHELKGLKGGHPLGALAAFGLLRVCAGMNGLDDVRLRWHEDALTAVLSITPPLTDDELIERLVGRQAGRAKAIEFNWADDIRTDPNRFADAAEEARADRRAQDFLAAYGCILALDGKQNLKPSAFHMTSGQQKFLEKTREIAESLEPVKGAAKRRKQQLRTPADAFREALFGPWRYDDEFHAFGWDPDTERLHALQAKSPTSEKPRSVRAAVWLAIEALPLFPCAVVNGALQTRGFSRYDRKMNFSWPLWSPPLTLDGVRSVVGLEDLTRPEPNLDELRACGIFAVFRAQRASLQKGYAIFRAAHPCLLLEEGKRCWM
jgi:hypothetical protein